MHVKRRWWFLLALLLLTIAVWWRIDTIATQRLADEIARIQAAGEPTSQDELRAIAQAPIPDQGAGGVVAAYLYNELGQPRAIDPNQQTDQSVFDASQHQYGREFQDYLAPPETLARAKNLLAANAPLLQRARQIAALPQDTTGVMVNAMLMEEQQTGLPGHIDYHALQDISRLLAITTAVAIREGDANAAEAAILDQLRLAYHLEPIVPAMLPCVMGIYIRRRTAHDAIALLESGHRPDSGYFNLRYAFILSEQCDWLARSIQHERTHRIGLSQKPVSFYYTKRMPWHDRLNMAFTLQSTRMFQPWAANDELAGLLLMRKWIDDARQCQWPVAIPDNRPIDRSALAFWQAPLTMATMGAYGSYIQDAAEVTSLSRALSIACALAEHHHHTGNYPDTLPAFFKAEAEGFNFALINTCMPASSIQVNTHHYPIALDSILFANKFKPPLDPLSGGPFAYQRTPDGCTLGTTNVERPILHLKPFPLFQNYSSFCPF
jgi:hypothetical protein